MPLTTPTAKLRRLRSDVASLATPTGAGQRGLLAGVRTSVKQLLVEEFATGTGPDGAAWQKTAKGEPALVSRKLPTAFTATIESGGVRFQGRVDWLEAHQTGHVFARRQGGGQTMIFRKGKLVSRARAARGWSGPKSWTDVTARAHSIGQRVLPQRQIYPENGLTPRWEDAIGRGLVGGMERWARRAGAA